MNTFFSSISANTIELISVVVMFIIGAILFVGMFWQIHWMCGLMSIGYYIALAYASYYLVKKMNIEC